MNWHIAVSPEGVSFRVEPGQELPEGWVRIEPGKADSIITRMGQDYFYLDGSLKERFTRLPIYGKGETK